MFIERKYEPRLKKAEQIAVERFDRICDLSHQGHDLHASDVATVAVPFMVENLFEAKKVYEKLEKWLFLRGYKAQVLGSRLVYRTQSGRIVE